MEDLGNILPFLTIQDVHKLFQAAPSTLEAWKQMVQDYTTPTASPMMLYLAPACIPPATRCPLLVKVDYLIVSYILCRVTCHLLPMVAK